MKLIRHQRLKRKRKRINVIHPARPPKHIRRRNRKARVNHQPQAQNRRRHHGLMRRPRQTRERAVDARHDQRGEVGRQAEEEEVARLAAEVRHEVHDDVEDEHVDGFVGQVHDVAGDGLCGLVDEGVPVLLFDYGAFGVDCQDLGVVSKVCGKGDGGHVLRVDSRRR